MSDNKSRELVARVADSPRFQKSPRLRDFLLFICEHKLNGSSAPLHEQEIGRRVYGRRGDYSTGDDNIVRVEARRLRKELDGFFSGEGAGEPVRIVIPKGSYLPVFTPREAPVQAVEEAPRRGWTAVLAALALVSTLTSVWLWSSRRPDSNTTQTAPLSGMTVWPSLLDPALRTHIVLADATLSLIQDISGREFSLADYAARRHLAGLGTRELGIISQRPLVGLASVMVVSKILQSEGCPRGNILVGHARDATARQFQAGNHILLGSRNSNPWSGLFDEKRNFRARPNWHSSAPAYLNVAPQADEQSVYQAGPASDSHYGVVSFLPNLNRSGSVLIIEGTSMAGAEAAWAFLDDHAAFTALVRKLGLEQQSGRVRHFELLLQTASIQGTPKTGAYVAHRLLNEAR